ncbi:MAG TPA: TIGR04282 family arsenosugar biosynthesis glycosyltransferase [Thermoanaerobaculia bacterium]|nr:TIGR04282 family arsenosugar biosynthesis glycosyltransferase [Thermoanaerobaculia bacterium]
MSPDRYHLHERRRRRLLLFTKPARQGRVKTRLIGDLTAAQAAELHAAFLADLLPRLAAGDFALELLWAVDPGEPVPASCWPGVASRRQEGADLGERLYRALAAAASRSAVVAALGSDHPTVEVGLVERAFAAVEAGADVALGPAADGGYYLIALAAGAVGPRLFEAVPWSTPGVLAATLERCGQLGLTVELLPVAADVDTPADLARLAFSLAPAGAAAESCPRTRALLASWRRLPAAAPPAPPDRGMR